MLKKIFFLMLVLMPVGLPLVVSGKDKDHDVAYEALQRGQILPLSKILAQTATQVSGEVIKVELDSKRLEYKLKVLSANGQVRKVRVDARNGTLLSIKDDD
ncbi:PepSY domain-containing protein [Herminiimonas glaciei]|uniref:PepSY domain-containing protein n=1 Tax=Herminiimonas glaciei TaxID=523788 RepID=A0ABW2I8H6_9BURK